MVLIQAGEFIMGNDSGESDEKPAHTVYLDSFYIDKFEVTNKNYNECVQKGNCKEPGDLTNYRDEIYFYNPRYSEYPVIYVDWKMAETYCKWRGTRLPTEAEWEKAARGTDERSYPWGNDSDCRNANFRDHRCLRISDTAPVIDYETGQSVYGVFNMAGNVWEWVADWYSSSYYSNYAGLTTKTPPTGPADGNRRVIRGGGFNNNFESLRVTNREGRDPTSYASHVGFRCVRPVSTDFP
jgi:formylglycine-generating enzyme required for sulfatase activity